MSCGADTTANELMVSLLGDEDFSVPTVDFNDPKYQFPDSTDLYKHVVKVSNEDVTTGEIDGNGTFDVLMRSISKHLSKEYGAGRITGGEYTKAYTALVEAGLSQAVQFVLQKEQVFWQNQLGQLQAITALIGLESNKVEYAKLKFDALTGKVNYAMTKIKLANEDAQYCISKYNLENILPAQLSNLVAEKEGKDVSNRTGEYSLANILPGQLQGLTKENEGKGIANSTATYNLSNLLPRQGELLDAQKANMSGKTAIDAYTLAQTMPKQLELLGLEGEGKEIQNDTATYNLDWMLPAQLALLKAQADKAAVDTSTAQYNLSSILPANLALLIAQKDKLLKDNETATYNLTNLLPKQAQLLAEQIEVQRAQTMDTRTDGVPVTGSVGKQKELFSQQILSYQRDSELKAAKVFSDVWITQKTMDEGLTAPSNFTNAAIDVIMTTVRANNGLT